MSFFSTMLLIEEIAKVDMSVSVLVDVQNTLVTPVIEQHGTEAQKQRYLTPLCMDTVGLNTILTCHGNMVIIVNASFTLLNLYIMCML